MSWGIFRCYFMSRRESSNDLFSKSIIEKINFPKPWSTENLFEMRSIGQQLTKTFSSGVDTDDPPKLRCPQIHARTVPNASGTVLRRTPRFPGPSRTHAHETGITGEREALRRTRCTPSSAWSLPAARSVAGFRWGRTELRTDGGRSSSARTTDHIDQQHAPDQWPGFVSSREKAWRSSCNGRYRTWYV